MTFLCLFWKGIFEQSRVKALLKGLGYVVLEFRGTYKDEDGMQRKMHLSQKHVKMLVELFSLL